MGKKWKGYFIFLIIMILLFLGVSIGEKLIKTYQETSIIHTDSFSIYPIIVLKFIVYSVAGMVFGLEKLYGEMKIEGPWKLNIPKLIILGIPSFFIGLLTFIPSLLGLSFANSYLFLSFMQMFFGYVIITSFYKLK